MSSIELAKLIHPEIRSMLLAGEVEGIREVCSEIHGADLVHLADEFDSEQQLAFFEALSTEQRIELFQYLPFERQSDLLGRVSVDVRQSVLNGLNSDDRARFVEQLPAEESHQVLSELTPKERQFTMDVLKHEERSAGRLMTPECLIIKAGSTVEEAFATIRMVAAHVETVYVAYVVDNIGVLVGTVSLRDLLKARSTEIISDIMTANSVSADVSVDQEELARTMKKYDLLAIPITAEKGRLVGIVTFDDIQDVIEEEASEDILRMHGVAAETDSYFSASVAKKFRQRLVVLVSLAVVSVVSVLLQQEYNYLISQVSILAVYLTMLCGSSGNCGTQMAGIIIRAQGLQGFNAAAFKKLIVKEVIVGLLMASFMALAAVAVVFVRGVGPEALGGHTVVEIAVVVGGAMFAALTTINLLGGIMPIVMKKVGLDPAITAGPFITTAADILTVLVYFNVARLLLG